MHTYTSAMIAPPVFKGRGGHNQPDLIVVKSKVVGVGICDALSCGGGSCAVVCDTVALKGRVGGVVNGY